MMVYDTTVLKFERKIIINQNEPKATKEIRQQLIEDVKGTARHISAVQGPTVRRPRETSCPCQPIMCQCVTRTLRLRPRRTERPQVYQQLLYGYTMGPLDFGGPGGCPALPEPSPSFGQVDRSCRSHAKNHSWKMAY